MQFDRFEMLLNEAKRNTFFMISVGIKSDFVILSRCTFQLHRNDDEKIVDIRLTNQKMFFVIFLSKSIYLQT